MGLTLDDPTYSISYGRTFYFKVKCIRHGYPPRGTEPRLMWHQPFCECSTYCSVRGAYQLDYLYVRIRVLRLADQRLSPFPARITLVRNMLSRVAWAVRPNKARNPNFSSRCCAICESVKCFFGYCFAETPTRYERQ